MADEEMAVEAEEILEEPAAEPEEVEAEVLEAGEQDVEPEPERRRYVQFLFDAKMMEFEVDWSSEQLTAAIDTCTKDDGFLWIPRDEEKDTGQFVNLNNCTGVTLVEREVPKPTSLSEEPPMPPEPPAPTEEELEQQRAERQQQMQRDCYAFLDQCAKDEGLPTEPSFREKSFNKFYLALIKAKFPELDDPELAYMDWTEKKYQQDIAGE